MNDAYEIFDDNLSDMAYSDCLIYYDREPTEEELEDMKECLMNKWS